MSASATAPLGWRLLIGGLGALLFLVAAGAAIGAVRELELLLASDVVPGEVTATAPDGRGCVTHYTYRVDGAERRGATVVLRPCPEGAVEVRVSRLDRSHTDLGVSVLGVAVVVFTGVFGLVSVLLLRGAVGRPASGRAASRR